MFNESTALSLVSQLKLPGTNDMQSGYFRSKLFVSSSSSNPFVSAASPLFSLFERLSISQNLPNIDNIHANISHELLAFHSRLINTNNHDEKTTAIAYYLMTSTVDELLGKNYIRVLGESTTFKAFSSASLDGLGPEDGFFTILDFIKERSVQYLDLLEFAYYCLIIGFEGKYHVQAYGRQALDNLIDELHQILQAQKVNKPILLLSSSVESQPQEPINNKTTVKYILATLAVIVSVYTTCYLGIDNRANSLLQNDSFNSLMDV
jgi:type VI secretion system protein ImpK